MVVGGISRPSRILGALAHGEEGGGDGVGRGGGRPLAPRAEGLRDGGEDPRGVTVEGPRDVSEQRRDHLPRLGPGPRTLWR